MFFVVLCTGDVILVCGLVSMAVPVLVGWIYGFVVVYIGTLRLNRQWPLVNKT